MNGDLMTYYIKKSKKNNVAIKEETIMKTCKTICKGLNILHSRNIVHKDIKPQNILIMKDFSFKVCKHLKK